MSSLPFDSSSTLALTSALTSALKSASSTSHFSQAYFFYLVKKYTPLFQKLARLYGIDLNDVISTAFLMMVDDTKFDREKGEYEPRFIFLLRNKIHKDFSSFGYCLTEEIINTTASQQDMTEIEEWRTDEVLKTKNIGGDLGKIVQFLLDGHDFEYCAKKLGLTLRRVEQIGQKAMAIRKEQTDFFR